MTADATVGSVDELEALRARYTAEPVPPCRVCGGEITIQSMGGGRLTAYAHSAPEGTSFREWSDHYDQSRWEQHRNGDSQVLAVIDELLALRATVLTPAPSVEQACEGIERIVERVAGHGYANDAEDAEWRADIRDALLPLFPPAPINTLSVEDATRVARACWDELADDCDLAKWGPESAATYTLDDMLRQVVEATLSNSSASPRTVEGLYMAMLGDADGGFIDPTSDIPAGEMFRLAAEYMMGPRALDAADGTESVARADVRALAGEMASVYPTRPITIRDVHISARDAESRRADEA